MTALFAPPRPVLLDPPLPALLLVDPMPDWPRPTVRADGAPGWGPEELALLDGRSVPLQVAHGPRIHSWGVQDDVGTAVFLWVTPGRLDGVQGLLALARVTDRVVAQAVERGARSVSGVSLGGNGEAEVSLCEKPAIPGARVVTHGPQALDVWAQLTEHVAREGKSA